MARSRIRIRMLQALAAVAIAAGAPMAPAQPPAPDAAFYSLGQEAGLRKIIDDFLVIAHADPRIKDILEGSNTDRLARLLTSQFCALLGGPCRYDGEPMKEVHQGLALTNAHFNALAEDLQKAMIQNNVPYAAQYALLAKLAPMQRDIVTR